MPAIVLVVPGAIETRTGGSIYDRQMAEGLRARGWSVDVREVDQKTPDIFATIADSATVVVDGLLFGAVPDQIERHAGRLRFVTIVHLPLSETPGLSRDRAVVLERREQRSLACAKAVVVTGPRTVEHIVQRGVPRERVVLIQPGTDRAPLAQGSGTGILQLLTVATVNAGKGHDVLIRALARLPSFQWHLTCVGSLDRDPAATARMRALVVSSCLDDRVTFTGELDEAGVAEAYDRADLFVLATCHETFGMAVAEAVARGLPVVSTTTGAIPDIVGDGGLLVPPGDLDALAVALARAVGDKSLRETLAARARAARDRLTTWNAAFDRMSAVLTRVVTDGPFAL
jgi:glycosyltransferase involved in cell wall biosynthesis